MSRYEIYQNRDIYPYLYSLWNNLKSTGISTGINLHITLINIDTYGILRLYAKPHGKDCK